MGQAQSVERPKRPVTTAVKSATQLPADVVRVVISYSEATLCGRLFVLGGGVPSNGHLSHVEACDPRHNKWIRLADLQNARFGLSAAIVHDRMYAIGGIIKLIPEQNGGLKQTPTPTVERYDPESGEWSFVSPMTTARVGHTSSVHFASAVNGGARIVCVGGTDCTTRFALSTTDVYDPRLDRWSPLTLPPIFVRDPIVGWRPDENLTTFAASVVATAAATASTLAAAAAAAATAAAGATATPSAPAIGNPYRVGLVELCTPRAYAVSAMIGHRLYVVGGTSSGSAGGGGRAALASGEMFDFHPTAESIANATTAAGKSIAANAAPAAAPAGPASAAPAAGAAATNSIAVSVADPAAAAAAAPASGGVTGYGWTPIAPMSVARSHFAGAVVDGRLIVSGGTDAMYGCTSEAYDPKTNTWSSLGLLCRHHARHASASVHNTIYLSGGRIAGLDTDGRSLVERWNPVNSTNATSKDGKGNGKGKWEDNVISRLLLPRASHAMCASPIIPDDVLSTAASTHAINTPTNSSPSNSATPPVAAAPQS